MKSLISTTSSLIRTGVFVFDRTVEVVVLSPPVVSEGKGIDKGTFVVVIATLYRRLSPLMTTFDKAVSRKINKEISLFQHRF